MQVIDFSIAKDASSADQLAEAAKAAVGKVDVLVTTADAKVAAYGEGMIKIAAENKIPTYASLSQLVKKGAVLSLGFNFVEAVKTVNVPQAIKILNGENAGAIPVKTYPVYKLAINVNTAKAIGIDIPVQALKTASEVIQ